jgi:prolyl 4-hydroxylase
VNYYADQQEFQELCRKNERVRINRSLLQPQSVYNYTTMGFTKIKAPKEMFDLLLEFWKDNRDKAMEEPGPHGRTELNYWKIPSLMASVEDLSLKGAGDLLRAQVWNATRDMLQEWTGQRLVECAQYGIRIYQNGAVLATHVDRLPLVASAIVNVDQDVDEPWPLEVIGHDGKAYNVTMVCQ